jgi:hypothetical protein
MIFVSKRKLMEENERLRRELASERESLLEMHCVKRELDTIKEQRYCLEREVLCHKERVEKLNTMLEELRGNFKRERAELLERIANAQDARCEILEKYTALLITLKEITEGKFNEAVSGADPKEESI